MKLFKKIKPSCHKCFYWNGGHLTHISDCKRHAPIGIIYEYKDVDSPYKQKQTLINSYPQTSGDDYCGDFKSK